MLAPLALLFAGSASALTVATPSALVQCQPILLEWSEGPAPYFVSVIPGGQASGAPLKDFGKQDGNSLTWLVDLPLRDVTIKVVDSIGTIQFSSQVTIREGSNKDCLAKSNTDGTVTFSAGTTATSSAKPDGTISTSPTTAPPSPTSNSTKPTTNSTNTNSTATAKSTQSGKSGARALITGAGAVAALGAAAVFALF